MGRNPSLPALPERSAAFGGGRCDEGKRRRCEPCIGRSKRIRVPQDMHRRTDETGPDRHRHRPEAAPVSSRARGRGHQPDGDQPTNSRATLRRRGMECVDRGAIDGRERRAEVGCRALCESGMMCAACAPPTIASGGRGIPLLASRERDDMRANVRGERQRARRSRALCRSQVYPARLSSSSGTPL